MTNTDGPLIIDTPEGIEHFRHCQFISCLSIEVNTGMRFSRGSVLKAAQQQYGVTARTKKGALDQMLALYEQTYGRPYGGRA